MDKNKIAVNVFNKLANVYQDKFMNVDLYGGTFDFFCDNIKKQGAAVFEIACGPGNITRYLLNRRPDLKIYGIDLAPNMIALAKSNNPSATFEIMDCRDIGMIKSKYDAIMCGFCLPYLSKEETANLVKNATVLLEKEGLFYLSTMEDDYTASTYKKGSSGDEIFMHYYPEHYLVTILAQNGLEILKTERKVYPEKDGTITTDLVIIAKKKDMPE